MKPVVKYILMSVSALFVLSVLIYTMWYFFNERKSGVCNRFEIVFTDAERAQLINERDVSILLGKHNLIPLGLNVSDIKTEAIENLVLTNRLIKNVECFKSPEGTVKILITQRTPKFRVVGFESYYIDQQKNVMPVSPNFAAYVPVVSGRVTKTFATGKLFDFVTFLELHPFWNAQIEQINILDDLKVELVTRVGDAIILLGTLDDFETKLNKLYKLYKKGFNVIGWNRYQYIDLQYKNQVVCSKISHESSTLEHMNNPLKTDSVTLKKI